MCMRLMRGNAAGRWRVAGCRPQCVRGGVRGGSVGAAGQFTCHGLAADGACRGIAGCLIVRGVCLPTDSGVRAIWLTSRSPPKTAMAGLSPVKRRDGENGSPPQSQTTKIQSLLMRCPGQVVRRQWGCRETCTPRHGLGHPFLLMPQVTTASLFPSATSQPPSRGSSSAAAPFSTRHRVMCAMLEAAFASRPLQQAGGGNV